MTARIEAALDALNVALRDGRLEALGELAGELDAALDGLVDADPATLRRLGEKAGRNALRLRAAAQGVRAARRRLDEIRSVRAGVVSYGPSGERGAASGPTQLARRF